MNQIMILTPYKFHGQWVFDDESTGLNREAFVAGIDTMLDILTREIPNAHKGVTLLFSHAPFVGSQIRLDWVRGDQGGNWYRCEEYRMDGWLCPALFKYFDEAPEQIYAQTKKRTEWD